MNLSNEKIKYLARKIYLARLNVLNDDSYYGYLLLNLQYTLDLNEIELAVKNKNNMHINPLLVENSSMEELENILITAMEKYLISINAYGINKTKTANSEKKINNKKDEKKDNKLNTIQDKKNTELSNIKKQNADNKNNDKQNNDKKNNKSKEIEKLTENEEKNPKRINDKNAEKINESGDTDNNNLENNEKQDSGNSLGNGNVEVDVNGDKNDNMVNSKEQEFENSGGNKETNVSNTKKLNDDNRYGNEKIGSNKNYIKYENDRKEETEVSDDKEDENKSNKSNNEVKTESTYDSNENEDDSTENEFRKKEVKYWQEKIYQAVKIAHESHSQGIIPVGAERVVVKNESRKVNWREQLEEFLQNDISDYSFTPPDRRFDDSPFFLPDFNEEIEKVENILFMIDTSASMSDTSINKFYSEIRNCLNQFENKIKGYIGCFDATVYNVVEFSNEEEFKKVRFFGGGGTSFCSIFEYINSKMKDKELKAVVILTDGYAKFPDKKLVNGLPVLWLISTKDLIAPIGRTVYFDMKG